MNVGEIIKKSRLESGLTQSELAKKISKSLRTIQKYESNEIVPKGKTITEIAKALNISSNELFFQLFLSATKQVEKVTESTLKYRDLLDNQVSISDYENKPLKEKDIKELFNSTIIDIMYLALESSELSYNVDTFSNNEIQEIADFVYNAYALKVNEILEKHKKDK